MRFIFIRRPSVLPASNIDEMHIEYGRLNAARLTRTRRCSASKQRRPKSGFSSLFSPAKQTRMASAFSVALGFVSLA